MEDHSLYPKALYQEVRHSTPEVSMASVDQTSEFKLDAWTDATHTARQYIARARSH